MKAANHIFDRVPGSVPILRLVVTLSPELRELGTLMIEKALRVVIQSLQKVMHQLDPERLPRIPDTEHAATLFLRMTIGNYEVQLLCGNRLQISAEQRRS